MVNALYNEIKENEELQIGTEVPKTAQSPYQTERIISQSLDIQPNGDVMIGDYANTYGCLWDQSAGTFNVKGTITSYAGIIGGWTIGATDLSATAGGNTTLLSSGATALSAGPTGLPTVTITQAGVLTATGASITGSITATSGTIGGFDIGADYLRDAANSFGLASTVSGGDDVRFWAGDTFANRATAPFRATEAGAVTASNITITGGSVATSVLNGTIAQTNLNVADRGWSQTCAFSITDADTIAWAAGVFTSADGTAYNIGAGNTGNMVAKTYIYLDIAVSTVAYQTTTTAATAVGVGKVLIAIAQNATAEATYMTMQGQGGLNIDAANIVAGSITANEIAATTITAGKMNVAQLSSIAADMGAITAGTITLPNTGYIRGGQTAYNTGTGFFLGYDTATYKLSIGDATTQWITWDGASLEATNISLVDTYTTSLAVTAGMGIMLLNDGKIAPTLADTVANGSPTGQFIGIATETKAAGLACKVRTTGKTTAVSGLTTGSIYYLSNTALVTSNTISQATQNASVDLTAERTQTFKPTKTLVTRIIIYTSGARTFTVAIKSGATTLGSKSESGPAGAGELSFTFTNPIFVTPGTSYTISITAGGFPDAFVYYNTNDVYADGAFSSGGDAYFKIYENMGDGVIGTSAGSVSKKAGLALSATSLQILNS